MTDTPDDENDVKKAMSRKRPVKGNFAVIDGGKVDGDEPAKPKRTRKRKATAEGDAPERDAEDPGPDNGDVVDPVDENEGGDLPPDLTDEQREALRRMAMMDQNDRDNGRRMIIVFGADMVFVQGMGWLVWCDTHWVRDEGELRVRLRAQDMVDWIKLEKAFINYTPAQARLLDAARPLRKKPEPDRSQAEKELLTKADGAIRQLATKRANREKFAVSSGNSNKTGAMLIQAASHKAVDQDDLDKNRMQFNLRNGTLRFWRELDPDQPEGGQRMIGRYEFEKHTRGDMITKMADVDYDADAKCPYFETEFLAKLQPDVRMQAFLQVFHAYALLIGGNDEQKLVYHYGTGANGKSAFIEVLGRLAGTYRTVVSPDTITGDTQRAGQQASPDIARLHNTRLATIEELPKNVPLKEELIKALSGGTKMTARFLQKDIFEFEPIFTPVLSGNFKPSIQGSDYGIWRRVLIVLWGITIPEEERMIPSLLAAKLDAERSGILNWLIDGLVAYLGAGLDHFIPAEVKAFTQEYRDDRDNIGVFADRCITSAPGEHMQAGPLHKIYIEWCEVNGLTAAKQRSFGDRLGELGFKKTTGRLYLYQDIKVDTSWRPSSIDFGGMGRP